MPSHIYVQVGDWDGVVESNWRAWAASEAWVERRDLADSKKDFHALSWLHYGLLQQGDFETADEVRRILRDNGGGHHNSEAVWAARRLIESEDWETKIPGSSSREEVRFARGYAAARQGDLKAAREAIEGLSGSGETEILRLELEALVAAREGKSERAVESLARAADLEEALRIPSGPPDLVKPALELYGEVLLDLRRCEEAAEAFERSLARMPGRRLSVRGAEATGGCAR
jgi:predicted Zn-dependent protease